MTTNQTTQITALGLWLNRYDINIADLSDSVLHEVHTMIDEDVRRGYELGESARIAAHAVAVGDFGKIK